MIPQFVLIFEKIAVWVNFLDFLKNLVIFEKKFILREYDGKCQYTCASGGKKLMHNL